MTAIREHLSRFSKAAMEDPLWKKWALDLRTLLFLLSVSLIFLVFFPEIFGPYHVMGEPFWSITGHPLTWMHAYWGVFAWGFGASIFMVLLQVWSLEPLALSHIRASARKYARRGLALSLYAGVVEELKYRWVLILASIPALILMDMIWSVLPLALILLVVLALGFLLFEGHPLLYIAFVIMATIIGFLMRDALDFDLVPLAFEYVLLPVTDLLTLGHLHDSLYSVGLPQSEYTWAWGAALFMSTGKFLRGHRNRGWFGYLNSWFIGMILLSAMLTYGLLAAMFLHVLYDIITIYTTVGSHYLYSQYTKGGLHDI